MEKINILLGRFQPLTIGHLKCAETALSETGLRTVLCMIGTRPEKVDSRHPFPSDLLLELYDGLLDKKLVADIILVKNANIIEIGKTLLRDGYLPGSWTCGTDRIKDYTRLAHDHGAAAGLSPDFRVIEIKRSTSDVSATRARELLMNDQKSEFLKIFPRIPLRLAGRQIYERLREQLLKVAQK